LAAPEGVHGADEQMPLAKPAFRRRLRGLIQALIYFSARLTRHARRFGL